MSITLKQSVESIADTLTQQLMDALPALEAGKDERSVPLAFELDAENADDQIWIDRLEPVDAMIEKAKAELDSAKTESDKAVAKAAYLAAYNLRNSYLDTAFGYVKDGKLVRYLKGSICDRINKAVGNLKENYPDWLASDRLYMRIDTEHRIVKVTRTRIQRQQRGNRPTVESAAMQIDALVKMAQKTVASETVASESAESDSE